jgi:FKBP-type peptidyl-prolyl cis-trans isomerase SlyD
MLCIGHRGRRRTMDDSHDPGASHRRVEDGDVVGFRYVIRSDGGQILAVSAEVQYYLHGSDEPQPQALASRMEGRRDGERFTASLSQVEAFGSRDPRKLALSRDDFPALLELEPGARVEATTPDGETVTLSVVEAARGEVLVDRDHPLAGQQLLFEVSIVSIRLASAAELSDGHPSRNMVEDARANKPQDPAPTKLAAMHDARAQLLALRGALATQFSGEEARGGLFEDLVANASRNHGRVRELSRTHAALLARLDAIVARVEREDGRFDHHPALAALVVQLERNETAKSTLLQDALNTDVGGEG